MVGPGRADLALIPDLTLIIAVLQIPGFVPGLVA